MRSWWQAGSELESMSLDSHLVVALPWKIPGLFGFPSLSLSVSVTTSRKELDHILNLEFLWKGLQRIRQVEPTHQVIFHDLQRRKTVSELQESFNWLISLFSRHMLKQSHCFKSLYFRPIIYVTKDKGISTTKS